MSRSDDTSGWPTEVRAGDEVLETDGDGLPVPPPAEGDVRAPLDRALLAERLEQMRRTVHALLAAVED